MTAVTAPHRPVPRKRLTVPIGLGELTRTEARLTLREPAVALFVLALPLGLLLVFGLPTAGDPPDPAGGQQAAAAFIPGMATVLALGMLGLFQLPSVLAGYREKGVLKRLATTPAPPISLLLAQLLVNAALALLAVAAVVAVAVTAVQKDLPGHVLTFVLGVVLGVGALFSLGLLVAALVPNQRVASVVGPALFFPSLFLAGLWLPRDQMPDWLATIGEYTPLGATLDVVVESWGGTAAQASQLLALAAMTAVFSAVAARTFRWQ